MKRALHLTMLLWYYIAVPQKQQPFHDTQGKPEITNTGQATYTIPIAMPPSLKNVKPVVNVIHQSGSFGGIAGQGLNISSVSAITRVSNRLDIDGSHEGLHFDATDKLALDGLRLLVVSGDYWHIGSVYQTETQSNLRIELQRSGSGIYFIVTAPDGSRSWYGNYDNNSTDLMAFYICRHEDLLGNFITYHYTKPFAKSLCLNEIRFSGNTHGLNPLNSIQFHYKKAQRTESAYVKGQKLEKMALLSHIEVKSNNQLFRKYVFSHIADPQLGYEKVSQIQEFNGAMEPANPVNFEYENTQTLGLGSELLTTYHNNLDFGSIVLSGDFDGDGRLDFTTENQIYVKNFLGTSGQIPVKSPIIFDRQDTFAATTLSDTTLNPFQSIVKYSDGEGFKIYNFQNGNLTLSYTKRFDFPTHLSCFNPIEPCTSTKNAFIEGDFNGDGISEVLLYKICKVGKEQRYTEYECGQFYWVDLNPTIPSLLTDNSLSTDPTPGATILSNPDLLIGKKRYVGDFNGDGKSDIFIINTNGTYKVVGFKQLTAAPWIEPKLLGKGTLSTYSSDKKILFGDFNGDGKTDIILPRANGNYNEANDWWDICYSNPKPDRSVFFEIETFRIVDYWQHSGAHFKDGIQYSDYYALDTNGDGKSDLVRIWRNKYKPKWRINDHDTNWKITSFVNTIGKANANGFTPDYETPCQNYDNSCDHHSDSPDMVIPIVSTYRQGINKEILMVRNHYNQVTYVNFTKDVAKDNLLKKVTAANGALIHKIMYQSLEPSENNSGCGNRDEFYSSSNSARYPNVEIKRLPFTSVVSRLTQTSGELIRHQDFRYHGYTVNMAGLGALGFIKTARSNWYQKSSDSKIWNIIQNDPTKRGLLINTYTQLQRSGTTFSFSSGTNIPDNAISSVVNEYAITTNNKVYTPLLTRQTTTDHLTSVKSVKNYRYQPVFFLPEIVRTQNFLDTTLQGETTVETEYQNNPNGAGNDYYIGRPIKTITQTNAYDDSQSAETLYTYNTNGTLLKTQQKPLKENYYRTEEFEYDSYGNVLKKTESTPESEIPTTPRITEYTYDPTRRFVIANKAITGQITQYSYHPLFGTIQTETNPDQLTTTTTYDNWGKPVRVMNYLGKSTYYTYTKNQNIYISQLLDADSGSTISQTNVLGQQLQKGVKLTDGQWSYMATQYDFLGRRVKESEPFVDTPTLWTSYAYDNYGRLVETTLPTGKTSRISYNGLTITTNDGIRSNSITKNANGHIISHTDNGGTVTYKYNANGAVTASDFQGVKITTQYDNWGRKSGLSDPSAGEYHYTYYPFGEVRTTITPKGIVKNFIDDFGRQTLTEEEPENSTSFYSRYYYNADHTLDSTIREEYTTGKVTDQMQYKYDAYKRIKQVIQITPNASFVKELTYDAYGRVEKEKQTATENTSGKNSSKTFRYGYRCGYRYQITDDSNGQTLWFEHIVNARDQLTKGVFGNGLHLSNQYDDYGYLLKSDIYHPNRNTSAGRPMLNLITQFDTQTGNLTSRKNNLVNHTATFQYDALDRLVQWDDKTQHYDDRGRIIENKLGHYNYDDNDKVYQNTSIDLNMENTSYYQNREGIFNDGMEAQKGWSDLGIGWSIFGKPIYDDSKAKSGKYSLKIHNPTDSDLTLHSDHWIPVDNSNGSNYTFSGWVYSDRPSSQIFLFMNSETETGYYTIVADKYTEVTNQWVYLERTVYVPSNIKKLNIRVDNNGGGNVWFDDIRIRKTDNPKTDLRQLNVSYDIFKKPISITETGVEKVAISYTSDHFRNTMYYGGLKDPEQQPFRKDYAGDGSMEITTNQQTGETTFAFFVGGDGYTAPVVFKDKGTTSEYLYLHRDYQGSIVAISDQHGNFVEKRLFDPWGNITKVQDGQGRNLAGLTLLDRGYTGHEHIQGVGIINMNGRIYDPKLHRFLSPDNYVQDPYNTQNYNRYGYCWNNPLKYTDPDGEFVWFVPVIFATVNIGVDLLIHDGKMNFSQIAMSAGMGAVGGFLGGGGITTIGQALLTAGVNQLNRFLPNIPIYQSANFNLGISPMIGFGSSGFTAGGNLNVSGKSGDFAWDGSVSAGYNSGMSSLGEAAGSSFYWGIGGFTGYNDGHANYGIGLSSTTFSGNTAQRVGAVNAQIGDFRIRIDEDYLPHIGDKYDRYRTGGLLATYKINDAFTLAIGGSMLTGEMMKERTIQGFHPKTYNYTYEKMHHLRAGTLYSGVINKGQSFFAGHNSEKKLHDIQNWIHRGSLKRTIGIGPVSTPFFYDFNLKSRMYSYFGSYHSSYLYY